MKKLICFLLILILVFNFVPMANAQEMVETGLYSVYGDGMLLQQNKTSYISGTGKSGDLISLELVSGENVVFESETTVGADGEFSVGVDAPEGGFTEYKIILSVNGVEFRTLNNIVFGELWIANGQSNMQYPLAQAKYGRDLYNAKAKLNKWLRVLYVPDIPAYKGSKELVPVDPQREIPGAFWLNGENEAVYSMSAVAYYFAEKLKENLDVPVGIINVPLGGTTIAAWLSREAIDSDPVVKNALVSRGTYLEKSSWTEAGRNVYHDMTTNYNLKMEGIRDFAVSGMIWYQGESDVMLGWSDEEYAAAFDLMQRSYSQLFNFDDGLLPIIFTQLASYNYTDDNLILFNRNISFTQIQSERPDSRAVISIHDVAPTYLPEAGSIHPECKKEVGERMAFAAAGLVYDCYPDYTAPTVKSTEIKNSSVYVTFNNVGDGLSSGGKVLKGFAVCSDDGIYVSADAEIVSPDTVRIYSDDVKNPVSATYAYYTTNLNADLYATYNGSLTLPVSVFVTNEAVGTHYWTDKPWADCDVSESWHFDVDPYAAYYPTWLGDNADISFTDDGVNIKKSGSAKKFLISPMINLEAKNRAFRDVDCDYSDYGTMRFYVRNNSDKDITLKGVRFYVNSVSWYAPDVNGSKSPSVVIPADNQWHEISLDLNRLYFYGNEGGTAYTNEKLDDVKDIDFVFSSDDEASLTVDNIKFTPSASDEGNHYDPDITNADNIIEFFSALVITVIGWFANIFR